VRGCEEFFSVEAEQFYPATMSAERERSLSAVYSEALERYRVLHREGHITDTQFHLLKQSTSLGDVVLTTQEAQKKRDGKRTAVDRVFQKITPELVSKVETVSNVVVTIAMAAGK
jgi:hypothetical protein